MMQFTLFLLSTLAIAGDFTTSLGDAYPYMISAITTDAAGNTYVVGSRAIGGAYYTGILIGDPSSITTVQSFLAGGSDVFVSKLDPNGQLLFTDIFAGKGVDTGTAIALDPSGNIYIAGMTTSSDFPLSKALQTTPNAAGTGFIMKLSNDGTTILYSTYLGGTQGQTSISSLATDSKGNLYLTGYTNASDYPHTPGMPAGKVSSNPLSTATISGAILTSISAAGDKILYSGVLAGTVAPFCPSGFCPFGIQTAGASIAVNASGSAYIAGNSDASNLPSTPGAMMPSGVGGFVAKVNATGTGLSYLTYIGSAINYYTHPTSIAVDAAGNAYLGGSTGDPKLAITPGAFQSTFNSTPSLNDGFLAKLKPDASGFVWATYLGAAGTTVQSIAADAAGNVWATGTATSATFPNATGWSTGTDFVVGLNAAASQTTFSQLYPDGTAGQFLALDPSGLLHVAGRNGFVSAIAPAAAPTMKIFNFTNAFGGSATARIAPGEVISIYGPGIGPSTAASAAPVGGFYPKTLAGAQVTINGINMPLLYVSANQINAVVPMALATGAGATVRVIAGNNVSPGYPVWLAPSAPQAYPAVLNQDGTINSKSNPAKGGSTVTFYATGWPSNFSGLADGQVATTAFDSCTGSCQVSATGNIFTPNATVTYGGVAPGIVAGVTQFNVHIAKFAASYGTFQFNFLLTGPAAVTQSVWIAP